MYSRSSIIGGGGVQHISRRRCIIIGGQKVHVGAFASFRRLRRREHSARFHFFASSSRLCASFPPPPLPLRVVEVDPQRRSKDDDDVFSLSLQTTHPKRVCYIGVVVLKGVCAFPSIHKSIHTNTHEEHTKKKRDDDDDSFSLSLSSRVSSRVSSSLKRALVCMYIKTVYSYS